MKVPQIALKLFQVTKISFSSRNSEEDATGDLDIRFNFSPSFSETDKNVFSIDFIIAFTKPDNSFDLVIEAAANFHTDHHTDEEFRHSMFVKANAPAIAFPYLRAYISNFTLNSGYRPLILPSFNFMSLADGDKGGGFRQASEEESS